MKHLLRFQEQQGTWEETRSETSSFLEMEPPELTLQRWTRENASASIESITG
jgi:hypothetical protein